MATIAQLMQSRVPGEIRIRRGHYPSTTYFIPYYKTEEAWFGTNQDGEHDVNNINYTDWELYTEPKKKVALYLWAVVLDCGILHSTTHYFASEEDLREVLSNIEWCQRLDYTKIEVEEG